MQHRKRRDRRHVMEEESGILLRAMLPKEWVIHEYKPDYGIDGTVEIFETVGADENMYETLGEHIFFQLKSINKTTLSRRIARSYGSPLAGGKKYGPNLSVDYEAFTYDLEVSELLTVEAMGASVAVVLFVVALDTRMTYMINLTDYIERVLDREDPDWRTRTKKRIFIPSGLTVPGSPSIELLRIYGGRSKLMHLFNVASYQYDELKRVFREKEMRPLAARFCERLLALDVWRIGAWILPVHYFQQLRACQDVLAGNLVALARLGAVVDVEELREMGILEETIDHLLLSVWQGLRALGATYEERIREWGMPTYLGITDAGLRNEG